MVGKIMVAETMDMERVASLETQVGTNKDNISELWKKWNIMQTLLIINLVGVILLLARVYVFVK